MRIVPFTAIAVLAVASYAAAHPAAAQTTPPAPHARPAHVRPAASAAPADRVPLSRVASNIDASDSHGAFAPRLPVPPVDDNAQPVAFLTVARQAIAAGQTGEAQEALERAETRMLDRSVSPSAANKPDQDPLVTEIALAREDLAAGHREQAIQQINDALLGRTG